MRVAGNIIDTNVHFTRAYDVPQPRVGERAVHLSARAVVSSHVCPCRRRGADARKVPSLVLRQPDAGGTGRRLAVVDERARHGHLMSVEQRRSVVRVLGGDSAEDAVDLVHPLARRGGRGEAALAAGVSEAAARRHREQDDARGRPPGEERAHAAGEPRLEARGVANGEGGVPRPGVHRNDVVRFRHAYDQVLEEAAAQRVRAVARGGEGLVDQLTSARRRRDELPGRIVHRVRREGAERFGQRWAAWVQTTSVERLPPRRVVALHLMPRVQHVGDTHHQDAVRRRLRRLQACFPGATCG